MNPGEVSQKRLGHPLITYVHMNLGKPPSFQGDCWRWLTVSATRDGVADVDEPESGGSTATVTVVTGVAGLGPGVAVGASDVRSAWRGAHRKFQLL